MNIFKLLLELFLLYLAYKLIFDFIIPVYKTTKQMKQKMGEMQQKMEERDQQAGTKRPSADKAAVGGDYIDYEEVK